VKLPPVPDPAAVLTVNEVFGPTFQGEGPLAGQRAMFVRLSGCSLRCIH
jgi:7-carboxy-7-deazaguanine synthase